MDRANLAAAQARADQEIAEHRAMIGELVQAYRKAIADGLDQTWAMSSMTHQLVGDDAPVRVQQMGGTLAVAVAMLAEAADAIPGRALLDQPAVAYDPEDPNRPEVS